MTFDFICFFGFIALLLFIGMRAARHVCDQKTYLLAKKETGLFALTSTLVMTEFNTATLLAFAAMGYIAGSYALSLPLVFLIGLFFYALTAAKQWQRFSGYSVGQFFTQRYSPLVGKIASISLLLAMVGFSATYVKSLALLFTPLLGWNLWIISAIFVVITLLMVIRGGLPAIIQTDVVSFISICLFMIALFFLTPKPQEVVTATPLPPRFIGSLIALTMFTYILAPWYAQKINSAKNGRTAILASFLAAAFVFALYGCAILTTSRMRNLSIPPDLALPTAIQSLPFGLRGLGYALLFAASATTLTGVWSAMSSMVVGDFLKKEGTLLKGQLLTLTFALISYLLGNTLVDQILDKLILANIPVLALSFALLAGFYWKGATAFGALASIATGLFWGIGCFFYFGEENTYTWPWAIYGIPLIFAVGFFTSQLPKAFLRHHPS